MESKVAKNLCTGCGACFNICPKNAIEMKEDKEGFLYPVIDKTKCIDCNLCAKKCPAVNKVEKHPEQENVYAICGSDEVCLRSSSGGAFELIANQFFAEGGYICGASWSVDFKKVEHIIISDKKDLHKLQTSKYVQSEIGNSYKEVKTLLEEGKKVLFSGTPCQVGGLNNFLGKDYENLLTIDILCHGAPSPGVWRDYIEEISAGKEIESVNFRYKKRIGLKMRLSLFLVKYKDNSFILNKVRESSFYRAFLNNLILRNVCSECQYTTINRCSDITLGDFWGIKKYNKKLNNKTGISFCMTNSDKGKDFIKKVPENNFKIKKEVPITCALKDNIVLYKPTKMHKLRNLFFEKYKKEKSVDKLTTGILDGKKYDGIIVNFYKTLNNYGAILTAYALQQYFTDKGLDYRLLNYNFKKMKKYKKTVFYTFTQKYLSLTQEVHSKKDLLEVNSKVDNFVVGSDQVFRDGILRKQPEIFLFTETDMNKKRVAFSASFGTDTFDCNEHDLKIYKRCFKRFDAISTREKSGVDICKNTFEVDAEHIIDPVFLLDKNKFEKLIDKNNDKYKNKMVYYVLDLTDDVKKEIDKISKEYNIEIINLAYTNIPVEEFLTAIKTCKYFITDSFHGSCFAMIFNTNFKAIINKARGAERFISLVQTFNNSNHFVDISEGEALTNLDTDKELWNNINNKIKEEQNRAEIWFKEVFSTNKIITSELEDIEKDFKKHKNVKFASKIARKGLFKIDEYPNQKIIFILGIKISIKKKGCK